jgi:Zn-dependent protease with chaperone function
LFRGPIVRGERRWRIVLGCAWLCAGCAGPSTQLPELDTDLIAAERRRQQIDQMRDYYAQRARVDAVAYRIGVANRSACAEQVTARVGLTAATAQSLPLKYRSYARDALAISWTRPTVIAVVAGSPAAAAGIGAGDEILTFNNVPIPPTAPMNWLGDRLKRNGTRPVTVVLRRDGSDRMSVLSPVVARDVPVRFTIKAEPGAYTDDEKIVIQSGLLRLLRSDADLATIIGHELAHVTMGHHGKRIQNTLIGQIGGAMIDSGFVLGGVYTGGAFSRELGRAGALAHSVDFEREADYIGAYYAVRAGYDISGAADVWRAMALGAARGYPVRPYAPDIAGALRANAEGDRGNR